MVRQLGTYRQGQTEVGKSAICVAEDTGHEPQKALFSSINILTTTFWR
jgi:hypothetical protein